MKQRTRDPADVVTQTTQHGQDDVTGAVTPGHIAPQRPQPRT